MCDFAHSMRQGYGENLYVSSETLDEATALTQASQAWWAENTNLVLTASNTTFTLALANANPAVGHFTQVKSFMKL